MSNAAQIFEVFETYDKDGDGTISKGELNEALERILGAKPTEEDMQGFLQGLHLEEDGGIGLIEFASLAGLQNEIAQWKGLFNQVDADGSGMADPEELIEVFKKSGSNDPDKDLKDMYEKSQKTPGESFSLDEFVAAIIFGAPLKKGEISFNIPPLSQERIAELTELFNKYEISGHMDKKALKQFLQDDWKREPSHKEVKYVMKKVDTDGNKKISKSEFIVMMGYANEVAALHHAFDDFDGDKNGKLEKQEVVDMLKKLGVKHAKKEAARILHTSEGKRKKYLNFEHFLDYLLSSKVQKE